MANPKREAYVERVTSWTMPDRIDPDLARDARASRTIEDVYRGRSRRIMRMVRLAYLRGIRRGASIAWEARQLLSLRDAAGEPRFSRPCGCSVVFSESTYGGNTLSCAEFYPCAEHLPKGVSISVELGNGD